MENFKLCRLKYLVTKIPYLVTKNDAIRNNVEYLKGLICDSLGS